MEAPVPVEQQLCELEERLLQPGVRGSAGDTGALLAEDFIEFRISGLAATMTTRTAKDLHKNHDKGEE